MCCATKTSWATLLAVLSTLVAVWFYEAMPGLHGMHDSRCPFSFLRENVFVLVLNARTATPGLVNEMSAFGEPKTEKLLKKSPEVGGCCS